MRLWLASGRILHILVLIPGIASAQREPAAVSRYGGWLRAAGDSASATLVIGDLRPIRGQLVIGSEAKLPGLAIAGTGTISGRRWRDSLTLAATIGDGGRLDLAGEVQLDALTGSFFVSAGPHAGQTGTWRLAYESGTHLQPGDTAWRDALPPLASQIVVTGPGTAAKRPSQRSLPGLTEVSSGSGIVVATAGAVLTNAHVVADCRYIRIRPPGGDQVAAAVRAVDPAADLALIGGDFRASVTARFREGREIRPGDDIVAVGYPLRGLLADEANVAPGAVTAVAGIGGDRGVYQISAPVQPGNSGGPLLDRSGWVVGVVVSKLNAIRTAVITGDIPQNVNFAIKGPVALRFLEAHGVAVVQRPPGPTLTAADVGDVGRSITALVSCWQ